MDLGLSDKVVIVTGGGSGIGAAVVLALAEEGAVPVIVDRDPLAAAMQRQLEAGSARFATVRGDLTDERTCERARDAALDAGGVIDGLVNNAGVNDRVGLAAGREAFVTSLERNLVHYYLMAHHCAAQLRAQRGSIVNVASKVAVTGQGGTSGYAAAKGGVLALTREWAAELAADGVRVNAVVPAEVMTPMYRRWLGHFDDPDAALTGVARRIPLDRRMTAPEEIAATVVFALSPRAGHTTGQWLFPDGGYVHLDRALE